MTLSESSAHPELVTEERVSETRENNPVLAFVALVVALIAGFWLLRKYVGTLAALITIYLAYVYRKDIQEEVGRIIRGAQTHS